MIHRQSREGEKWWKVMESNPGRKILNKRVGMKWWADVEVGSRKKIMWNYRKSRAEFIECINIQFHLFFISCLFYCTVLWISLHMVNCMHLEFIKWLLYSDLCFYELYYDTKPFFSISWWVFHVWREQREILFRGVHNVVPSLISGDTRASNIILKHI